MSKFIELIIIEFYHEHKLTVVRLEISAHFLPIETCQMKNKVRKERLCPFCLKASFNPLWTMEEAVMDLPASNTYLCEMDFNPITYGILRFHQLRGGLFGPD